MNRPKDVAYALMAAYVMWLVDSRKGGDETRREEGTTRCLSVARGKGGLGRVVCARAVYAFVDVERVCVL